MDCFCGCGTRIPGLLLLLHGEGQSEAVEQCEEWLQESLDQRAARRDMTERGSLVACTPRASSTTTSSRPPRAA
jgi:hypothetical protein